MEVLSKGRHVIDGRLNVVREPIKKRYGGLLAEYLASALETPDRQRPRYPDLHAVWTGIDLTKPAGHQLQSPFYRYKAPRPIDGLSSICNGHRVRLTCTVGEAWGNGLGAYITRAHGECLEVEEHIVLALAGVRASGESAP